MASKRPECRANVPNILQRALNVRFVPKQLACAYRAVSDMSLATLITSEQRGLTNRESRPQRKVATLAKLEAWHRPLRLKK